jgi:hypothetical protein
MAKISVIVCDLCKKLTESVGHKLQLSSGKGEGRVSAKAEICQGCYDGLKSKIDSPLNLGALTAPAQSKKAGDGAIVPSSAENIAASPRRNPPGPCTHTDTKFESPFIICLNCGMREST